MALNTTAFVASVLFAEFNRTEDLNLMPYSIKEIYEVPCIKCNAVPGAACTEPFGGSQMTLVEPHEERATLRKRMPALEAVGLSATDKSLICYYAFVILCDSCSINSVRLFNKQISSVDIQRAFAREAIKELKKDGLLGNSNDQESYSPENSLQVRPNNKTVPMPKRRKTH